MSIAFQSSFVDSHHPLPKQLEKKKFFLVYFPFSVHPFPPPCSLSEVGCCCSSGGLMPLLCWKGERGPSLVKTPHFHCRGHRFDPWLGNQGPASPTLWPKQNKNSKERERASLISAVGVVGSRPQESSPSAPAGSALLWGERVGRSDTGVALQMPLGGAWSADFSCSQRQLGLHP